MTKKRGKKREVLFNWSWSKPQVPLSDLIAVKKDLREERGMDWKEVCFRHDTQFQAASHCDGGRIDAVHLNSVIHEGKPGISASFVFFWYNKARFRVVFCLFPTMLVFFGGGVKLLYAFVVLGYKWILWNGNHEEIYLQQQEHTWSQKTENFALTWGSSCYNHFSLTLRASPTPRVQ